MNKLSVLFLSVFLFLHAFHILTDINSPVLLDIKAACALVAGILCLYDFAFHRTCKEDKNHYPSHWGMIAFVLLAFSVSATFAVPPPIETEKSRWAAAEVVALNVPLNTPAPSPNPNPTPGPQQKCERCQGTGKIKPDGRIEVPCPDCHGTGVITFRDIIGAIGQLNKDLSRVEVEHAEFKKQMSDSAKQSIPLNPPMPAKTATPIISTDNTRSATTPVIHWLEELNGLQQRARLEAKPLFIFWTADFCTPCEEAKAKLLVDPDILNYLDKYFVCAKINCSKEEKDTLDQWEIYNVPNFSLVLPDWTNQVHLPSPDKGDLDPWNPQKFLAKLQDNHKYLYIKGAERAATKAKAAMQQRSIRYANNQTLCNCARTGVCTCGPNCQCQDCPDRTEVRYAIQYVYPQQAYAGYSGGGGWSSCSGGSCSGGGCSGGSCSW